ncbi:methyltransferase type 11 [Agaricicola taiwanensis]|uniref:Methyltransferase type 11 n=1 Tax=Agaricicola taiwanensis TaxID=591372 RepID=A0A8J3DZ88_9RHOB|nr:methyltransferase domain-containing protein [Agaricicola taiwanensis]GGE51013.1 methyltransferase type 11 [Agaricicola taiwanensis]
MSFDVVDLRDFYAQPLGQMVRRILRAKLRAHWRDVSGSRILGMGYASPFLGAFREEAERLLAFMPAEQGVTDWPTGRPTQAALVEADMWPLPDAAVDRVLAVHMLEVSSSPEDLLREAWRTLAPGGRIMLVVPNRRGLWSRFDTTPFGQGRPYSRGQLHRLLRDNAFAPTHWNEALFFPPFERGIVLRSAVGMERFGARLWAPFAGVHIVEAGKQVYRPIPARKKVKTAKLKPAPAPVGALAPGG